MVPLFVREMLPEERLSIAASLPVIMPLAVLTITSVRPVSRWAKMPT